MFLEDLSKFINDLPAIPSGMYTIAGAAIAWLGIIVTNRGHNKRLQIQIQNDSTQRERDRAHSLEKLKYEKSYEHKRQICILCYQDSEGAIKQLTNFVQYDSEKRKAASERKLHEILNGNTARLRLAGADKTADAYAVFVSKYEECFEQAMPITFDSAKLLTLQQNYLDELFEMNNRLLADELVIEEHQKRHPGAHSPGLEHEMELTTESLNILQVKLLRINTQLAEVMNAYDMQLGHKVCELKQLQCNLILSIKAEIQSQ